MKIDFKFLQKRVLPVIIGAGLGYAYYYFIGCNTGSCPITSNPYSTTAYGAVMGLIFALPSSKKKKGQQNETNN